MKVGVVIPTYDQYGQSDVIRGLIGAAETLGYDSAWFGDHIVVPEYAKDYTDPHWFEALTCAFAGIGMTSRLSFGTDVLVAPYRDPILVAKMAATASELSGGRLMLGLGVGFLEGEFEALGRPPYARRGAVTDEYLRVLRLLLESKADAPLSFEGEWVRFENIRFGPRPANPPPLLVGGNHPKALERAGRLGDGWHPLWPTPDEYAEARQRVLAVRRRHQIDRPFTFSFSCPYTRLLAAGEPVRRDDTPWEGAPPRDYAYSPPKPRTSDGRDRFIGTAAQLREDLTEYAAAGVDQVVLRFAFPWDREVSPDRFVDRMEAFAADVLPAAKALRTAA